MHYSFLFRHWEKDAKIESNWKQLYEAQKNVLQNINLWKT